VSSAFNCRSTISRFEQVVGAVPMCCQNDRRVHRRLPSASARRHISRPACLFEHFTACVIDTRPAADKATRQRPRLGLDERPEGCFPNAGDGGLIATAGLRERISGWRLGAEASRSRERVRVRDRIFVI
jgi:hypothetical protein